MSGDRLKLGILISGRGTNMAALIAACAVPDFPAEVALVISNRSDAGGLAGARAAGIPTRVIPHGDYPDRESFDAALDDALRAAGVELVCLAGFMRLLSAGFVRDWHDRAINIHPSLLPAFKGLDVQARAVAAGVRFSGCTVHFLRPAMDDGPIIVQAAVPVLSGDTGDSLAMRILAAEHRCYPLAVRLIAEGRARVVEERVEIDGAEAPSASLINPTTEG
ncbi:MAG: phosphoribosylglycinamide formyltransferase [Alphaproteobacteria bacterium]|nr:phosphoribosylglycinamide formyltransferase [Alphaproteobacteria bacterium]